MTMAREKFLFFSLVISDIGHEKPGKCLNFCEDVVCCHVLTLSVCSKVCNIDHQCKQSQLVIYKPEYC